MELVAARDRLAEGEEARREARAALAAAQAEGHRLEAQAGRLEQDLDAVCRCARPSKTLDPEPPAPSAGSCERQPHCGVK